MRTDVRSDIEGDIRRSPWKETSAEMWTEKFRVHRRSQTSADPVETDVWRPSNTADLVSLVTSFRGAGDGGRNTGSPIKYGKSLWQKY